MNPLGAKSLRINVGCGMSPTDGWLNFDNSPSVRMASALPQSLLPAVERFLTETQRELLRSALTHRIAWADVTRRLPLPDASVEVMYSSHMLEHLDAAGAQRFLAEARRVLIAGGILRIAVPDLAQYVNAYLLHRDADRFVQATYTCIPAPASLSSRVRAVLVGPRHHQWMYDGASLSRLLLGSGFKDAVACPAGETRIPNPGALNLHERSDESVYVEAFRA